MTRPRTGPAWAKAATAIAILLVGTMGVARAGNAAGAPTPAPTEVAAIAPTASYCSAS